MRKLLFSLLLLSVQLFAANATPVAVSSMTVSGSTVTVNTALAHGLTATGNGQGFCISGSSVAADNVCGAVLTAPTSTSLTFTMAGLAACSATCGSIAPAPQVIVQSVSAVTGETTAYSYLLWLTSQQPCPGPTTSAWKAVGNSTGATTAQSAAIAAGRFVEVSRSLDLPATTPIATVQALLQTDFAQQQGALVSSPACQFYGQNFDSFGWGLK